MEQIFIKFKNKNDRLVNKDILDSTGEERLQWYNSSSKTELAIIVEKLIKEELRVK